MLSLPLPLFPDATRYVLGGQFVSDPVRWLVGLLLIPVRVITYAPLVISLSLWSGVESGSLGIAVSASLCGRKGVPAPVRGLSFVGIPVNFVVVSQRLSELCIL